MCPRGRLSAGLISRRGGAGAHCSASFSFYCGRTHNVELVILTVCANQWPQCAHSVVQPAPPSTSGALSSSQTETLCPSNISPHPHPPGNPLPPAVSVGLPTLGTPVSCPFVSGLCHFLGHVFKRLLVFILSLRIFYLFSLFQSRFCCEVFVKRRAYGPYMIN